MNEFDQSVAVMVDKVLARQAKIRAVWSGESFEEALESVLGTKAGRQLRELGSGPHRHESAAQWQDDLAQKRFEERRRARQEERRRAWQQERREAQLAAFKSFMQAELRELELRKGGQLARLLGEALPGEPPAALERLASEDQRQATEGLVALMRGGKVSYKHLEELCPEEMPARMAANRLRETWLKERRDSWLGRGEGSGEGSR
jgi:hypothetical protein